MFGSKQSLHVPSHQGAGQEGQDVDEVGAERQGPGGQSQGAHP